MQTQVEIKCRLKLIKIHHQMLCSEWCQMICISEDNRTELYCMDWEKHCPERIAICQADSREAMGMEKISQLVGEVQKTSLFATRNPKFWRAGRPEKRTKV